VAVLSAIIGPLRALWFNDGPRRYDLPRDTLDERYTACAEHHPACDCREASIAEAFAENRAEAKLMYNAILAAIKGHNTYPAVTSWEARQFEMCKCVACDIARKARVGYFEHKRQRQQDAAHSRREQWKRLHPGATLAPAFPAYDDEVPF
jgi:hypothetical protein